MYMVGSNRAGDAGIEGHGEDVSGPDQFDGTDALQPAGLDRPDAQVLPLLDLHHPSGSTCFSVADATNAQVEASSKMTTLARR